jgi:FRG domain
MLEGVLDRVAELQDRFAKEGSAIWFRGQRSSGWQLKSTLHRHIEAFVGNFVEPFDAKELREFLRAEAKRLYRKFKADAWRTLRHEAASE